MSDRGIGQPVPRFEDARFLTGAGRYVADINLPHQAYAYVVRSQYAAGTVRRIDTDAANACPGVLRVFTSRDIGDELGLTSVTIKRKRPDGTPMFWRPQHALAVNRVRYVGEPVALVVAETLDQARDAAELVTVECETTDAVTDAVSAMQPDSPRVWDDCPDNISNQHEVGDRAATDALIAQARHVVRRQYTVSRVHCQYMEPRGAVAAYDQLSGRYTLCSDVQSPHQVRDVLANEVLRISPERLRVVAYDIGGAFGAKAVAVEHRLILWAARRLGRAIKWLADRSETILADEHGRDNAHVAELALDADGRFLAFRAHWIANVGAYISGDRNFQSSFLNLGGMLGVYRFAAAFVRSTCVMTNTGPLAPYRGAGRPEATYVIERLIDDAARELGFDRIELRRKNFIPPEDLPYRTPLNQVYDCGEFEKCMDMALDLGDFRGFEARRQHSRSAGLLRGFGIANPIERAAPAQYPEYAELRLDPLGRATLLVGTKNHGQGHETAFAQIVGSKLGIDPAEISFVDGDTDRVAYGSGTFGSRSGVVAGTAIRMAVDKIIDKGTRIAAHLLEAAAGDVTFEDGVFSIAGTDRRVSLQDVARAAYTPGKIPADIQPGLLESATWIPSEVTFPYGTHVCEVEVDRDTGTVRIDRYAVVDDVGAVINPLIVKGQIHGGVGQGIGQVLLEQIVYDPASGQCLTGSFADYAMPRADDFCDIKVGSHITLTRRNPLGVKGAGEAGCVGALPVVMNAIMDALRPLGVEHLDMPATPARVWQAIQEARRRSERASDAA